MKRTVTFGEIMLRLKTPEHMRILQTDAFEASYDLVCQISLCFLEI